jgi:hypothetical protein
MWAMYEQDDAIQQVESLGKLFVTIMLDHSSFCWWAFCTVSCRRSALETALNISCKTTQRLGGIQIIFSGLFVAKRDFYHIFSSMIYIYNQLEFLIWIKQNSDLTDECRLSNGV